MRISGNNQPPIEPNQPQKPFTSYGHTISTAQVNGIWVPTVDGTPAPTTPREIHIFAGNDGKFHDMEVQDNGTCKVYQLSNVMKIGGLAGCYFGGQWIQSDQDHSGATVSGSPVSLPHTMQDGSWTLTIEELDHSDNGPNYQHIFTLSKE